MLFPHLKVIITPPSNLLLYQSHHYTYLFELPKHPQTQTIITEHAFQKYWNTLKPNRKQRSRPLPLRLLTLFNQRPLTYVYLTLNKYTLINIIYGVFVLLLVSISWVYLEEIMSVNFFQKIKKNLFCIDYLCLVRTYFDLFWNKRSLIKASG